MAWFRVIVTISFSYSSQDTRQNSKSKANGKYFLFLFNKDVIGRPAHMNKVKWKFKAN